MSHTREFAVKDGVTITEGDLCALVNGRVRLAVTTDTNIIGVCQTRGDSVGVTLATVIVVVTMDPGAIFRVPQELLADDTVQPGDFLDINGTSDGLAASSNNDLIVYAHDDVGNFVDVQVLKAQMLFM